VPGAVAPTEYLLPNTHAVIHVAHERLLAVVDRMEYILMHPILHWQNPPPTARPDTKEYLMAKLDYTTVVKRIDGEEMMLAAYGGKVLLVVNTASECGFTPQFDGLEALWQKFGDRGLVVLGFPCNQFGAQDPGTNEDIASFCRLNYGVSFPMHERVEVNGSGAHPLFKQLRKGARGLLNTSGIKWNFTKFLVARDGTIVARYGPRTQPDALEEDIVAQLGQ
jgi:glutathione peroxidase